MQRCLIFWFVAASVLTILSLNDNLMIVKRDSSNYMIQQREEFTYRQLDDTISKEYKLIENYEGEDKRNTELLQGEITKRRVRDNKARAAYLQNLNR